MQRRNHSGEECAHSYLEFRQGESAYPGYDSNFAMRSLFQAWVIRTIGSNFAQISLAGLIHEGCI